MVFVTNFLFIYSDDEASGEKSVSKKFLSRQFKCLKYFHKQIVAAVDCLPRDKSISRGEICIEQGVEDKFLVFECLLLSLTATDRSFARVSR